MALIVEDDRARSLVDAAEKNGRALGSYRAADEAGVEPRLVLHYRAVDAERRGEEREVVLAVVGVVVLGISGRGVQSENRIWSRNESVVLELETSFAVEVVLARAGDDVDHAAGRA